MITHFEAHKFLDKIKYRKPLEIDEKEATQILLLLKHLNKRKRRLHDDLRTIYSWNLRKSIESELKKTKKLINKIESLMSDLLAEDLMNENREGENAS